MSCNAPHKYLKILMAVKKGEIDSLIDNEETEKILILKKLIKDECLDGYIKQLYGGVSITGLMLTIKGENLIKESKFIFRIKSGIHNVISWIWFSIMAVVIFLVSRFVYEYIKNQ